MYISPLRRKNWALLLLFLVSDISHFVSIFSPSSLLPQNWRSFPSSPTTPSLLTVRLPFLRLHFWPSRKEDEEKEVGEEDKIRAWALLWDEVKMHLGCWALENTLLLLVSNWPLWPCEEKDGRNSAEISVHGKQYAAIILFCPCYLGGTHPPDNPHFQHQYLLNISWQKYQDFLM